MTRHLPHVAFVAGLAALCWVGSGYVGANPLALAMTLLIGAFYVAGALELYRYRAATATLAAALADTGPAPDTLGPWLGRLHPSLQNAVRLRIEGERTGLPGPALAPYLSGLLVLLGMLGTFLGMVVTLNGTGLALESATDMQGIRASLSAPVKGLGLAFGTSVAGVATSAMLGLISALCRRERLQASQRLDAHVATRLRAFSRAHHRDESLRLLQQQAQAMPVLVDRLQSMMEAMAQQHQVLNERLAASQDRFHGQAEQAYAGLAASVDRSLKDSLAESARLAGAAIRPAVEATMGGIVQQTASLHEMLSRGVQQQLDGLSARIESGSTAVAVTWKAALDEHQRATQQQAERWRTSLDGFAGTFEQRSADLVASVAARLETAVDGVSATWRESLAQHAQSSQALTADTRQALSAAAAGFEQRAASLLSGVDRAHGELQAAIASRDEQRLAAWTSALASMAASLREEWQQAGAQAARQQQQVCDTLALTAREMSAQAEAQARSTVAEIAGLMQAAAQAPQAAAEVIGELRQQLSDGMARDNAMLDERSRILGTLATLLDAVNQAASEQRTAIDTLVAAAAEALDRAGTRFTAQAEAEASRMAAAAAQVAGGAAEVASLGEAFGLAVELFSQSNDKLAAHLQRIEGALGKSIARSDEQLAYYVAQAREVIDLSIMSQKQIVEDLQQFARRPAPEPSEA
ncbi:DUF802 domain-containing protein [Aquincola sp. MAHUQ-54]|uniref:DUF802 domain-containing protein n=1 Tax=Aquincola agrisoli TaxID=3119538 RepID=A0AAW9QBM5_9BURK